MMPISAPELPAIPSDVKLVTLDNGLTIIVREDHSAPVVSAQAWCRTGSIDEGKWLGAGLSHVLEHMLFKGTTTRGAGRIDQEVQDVGGYMNAYTSFDRTVYWINAPSTGAKVVVDVLCDIMQNATLPADELTKELDVIRREMDMNQDDPGRRAGRRLFETAYTRSPYRFTVIGYPDIFNELKAEDIVSYYREHYIPNNIFFVVVGDIKTDEVVAQIKRTFTARAKSLPQPFYVTEPKQTAPREIIEEAAVELGHFHFSWHIPGVRHSDVPALDVLAALLGSGRSARLYQEIREKKGLVTSIDAWTYNPGDSGLFGMSATSTADNFPEAKAAMLSQIERVQNELASEEELRKVIKQFIVGTLSSRKTMQGQAQDLGGSWMAADDLNFSERYLAAVKRVTPADLQRVAREYLPLNKRTLFALLPENSTPKKVETTDSLVPKPVEKITLPNGLRLLIKEDHRLPFVEFRMVFRGGVLAETKSNNGVTQLMAKMLIKGTKQRTAEEIVTEMESLGGSIDTFGGNNSFGISAEVLHEDFEKGLNILADVCLNPIFPKDAFDREKEIQLSNIQAQKDQMLQSGSRAMRHALFGEQSYGLDTSGSEESVTSLEVNQLRSFHETNATPDNCVLAIFGDVDAVETKKQIENYFCNWKKGDPDSRPKPAAGTPKTNEIQRVTEFRDKKQAVLLIGYEGTTIYDQDRYALDILQESCSDLGSRLFKRIRENLGLAYYVGAQQFPGLVPGYFAFYVGTTPEKTALVEVELLKEAEVLRNEGLSTEELQRSKAKILGQKKIGRQDLGGYAMSSALDELYGLGHDFADKEDAFIESVTIEQTKIVAQKYLLPDRLVIAIVRPEKTEE